MRLILVISLFSIPFLISAQTVEANFQLDDLVCKNEHISINNQSLNAQSYLWDFCFESFEGVPDGSESLGSISGASSPEGVELVMDGGVWYGFVSSQNGKLFRLEYDKGLKSIPIITEVLINGVTPVSLKDIRLIKAGSDWYGVLSGYASSKLYRLSFGGSLSNDPMGEDLGNLGGWNTLRGIDLAQSGDDIIVIVSSYNNNQLTMIRFAGGVMNSPDPVNDILQVSDVSLLSRPMGVSLIETSSGWYGLLASFSNNKLLKLNFGQTLFSDPIVTELTTGATLSSPTSVSIQREGLGYYGLVMQRNNGLRGLSFGNSMANSIAKEDNIGTLGQLSNVFAFRLKKDSVSWSGLAISATSKLSLISFGEGNCESVSIGSSTEFEPTELSFNTAGDHLIELTAYHANGNRDVSIDTITVTDQTAPDVRFTTTNQCVSNANTFTIANISGDIVSYSWDFDGDGIEDSTEPNPVHQYAGVGNYVAKVRVTNSSCTNTYADTVKIYNAPQAGFSIPTGSLCSKTPLIFSNTSIYDPGSPVMFSWDLDGDGLEDSAEGSPTYTYLTGGVYNVSLVVSLPEGCTDTLKQEVTVNEGYDVAFDWDNLCFGEEIQFVNQSANDASYSYQWNFGDGTGTSSNRNPSYSYSAAGSYTVRLTIANGNCSIPFSREVVVSDQPLVSASFGAGVQNVPTSFKGNDLTLSGDSIVSWLWDFGGLGSSTNRNAVFTFSSIGSYDIGLSITTAQGCTDSYSNTLVVEVPLNAYPAFEVSGPVCQDERLVLDNTSVNASSYLWDFCFESFEGVPDVSESLGTIAGASSPEGVELVNDGGIWYGFVSSTNGKLFRLKYTNGLKASPTVTEVLISGVTTVSLKDIRLIKSGSDWYGILSGFSSSKLYRLSFGSSLSNDPTGVDLGNLGGWSTLRGIDLAQSGDDIIVIVSSFNNNQLTMIRFAGGIMNTPDPVSDILQVSDVGLLARPMGVSLIETSSGWYGLLASFSNNKLLKLNFGQTLFSDPIVTELTTGTTLSSPTSVSIQREGLGYYALVMQRNSGLRGLSFGNSMANSITKEDNIGTLGQLSNVFAFRLKKDSVSWSGLAISSTSKLSLISFGEGNCESVSIGSSTEFEPTDLSFNTAGDHLIELTAYHANGNRDVSFDTISVSDQTAPDVRFTTTNQCVSNANTFTIANISGDIVSYSWDFDGDGIEDSTEPNPVYQYAGVGSFVAKVTVTNSSCTNTYADTVKIYNAPQAGFSIPTGSLCSKTPLIFSNTSIYDPGSPVMFSWDLDGDGLEDSAEGSPTYTYLTGGVYNVSLVVSLPEGCTDTLKQEVTVNEGYDVAFDWDNLCFGEEIQFVNQSANDASYVYQWNFGDGTGTSSIRNPSYSYSAAGSYTVSLTIDNGTCSIPFSREVVVSDQPLVSASFGAGVQNVPTTFKGNDLTLSGDSIVSWLWDFGGLGISTQRNAVFTFSAIGSYTIGLSIETAQGCTDNYSNTLEVEAPRNAYPAFEVSGPVCQGERLVFENTSVNASSYLWDFCLESFEGVPDGSESLGSIAGTSSPEGVELVNDGGIWYGFVSSTNGKLFRLKYTNGLKSSPTVTEVLISGVTTVSLKDIRLIKAGSDWFGILSGYASSKLYRLSFGSSLSNDPMGVDLGNLGGWSTLRGIDLAQSGDDIIVIVSSESNNKVTLIRFVGGIMNTPDPVSDILQVSDVSLLARPMGVSLIETSSGWYGLLASFSNNKLLKLNFGQTLFSDPIVTELTTGTTLSSPTSVSIQREGLGYYGLVMQRNNGLRGLSFGNSMANSITKDDNIGTLGQLSNVFAFRLKKDSLSWSGLAISSTSKLSLISYGEGNCESVSIGSSTEFEPRDLSFNAAGYHLIELIAIHANGYRDVSFDTITVSDQIAPDISFMTTNQCVSNANIFTVANTSGDIVSYSWDFDGDGKEDSTEPNPAYQYTGVGSYMTKVSVNSLNGCENSFTQVIPIYPEPPVPSFSMAKSSYCQDEPIQLVNTTSDGIYNNDLTYYWIVPGLDTIVSKAPVISFDQAGTKTISVYSSIPGCQSAVFSKTINIIVSPKVAFSSNAVCFGEITTFTNSSEGITHLWDFGDGFTTNLYQPKHYYQAPGIYSTTLTETNSNGCQTSLIKDVFVGATPQPQFEYDLVCEGTEAMLTDVSIVNGADIVSWEWRVDEEMVSNERNPNILFSTQGNKQVSLHIFSSSGCDAEYSESIDVRASSQVAFDVQIACIGELSTLTDVTKSPYITTTRTWIVNGQKFEKDDATINMIFDSAGSYTVSLMIDNDNLCSSELTKVIDIPALPQPDFIIGSVCDNQIASIYDATPQFADPVVSRAWYFEDTFIGNGTQIAIPTKPQGQYEITMIAQTLNGCTASISKSYKVLEKPYPAFSANNDFGVPPFTIDFINTSSNASQYTWKVNGEPFANEMNASHTFNTYGNFTVLLKAENDQGCVDSVTSIIRSVMPVVDIGISQMQVFKESGGERILLEIFNNSNLPVEAFDVKIDLQKEFQISERITKRINEGKKALVSLNVSVPIGFNLEYVCAEVLAPYGVVDQKPEDNETCVNLNLETIFEPAFPNPTKSIAAIRMILPLEGDVELSVIDLSGQLKIRESLPDRPSGLNTFEVDLSRLDAGTYVITIKHPDGVKHSRVIKQ